MFRKGHVYLAVDPRSTSAALVDFKRFGAGRLQVTIVSIDHNPLHARRRYTVRTAEGMEFKVGRLMPINVTK